MLRHYPERHSDPTALAAAVVKTMEARLDELRERMAATVSTVMAALSADDAARLSFEYERWCEQHSWTLINAADPCGT